MRGVEKKKPAGEEVWFRDSYRAEGAGLGTVRGCGRGRGVGAGVGVGMVWAFEWGIVWAWG